MATEETILVVSPTMLDQEGIIIDQLRNNIGSVVDQVWTVLKNIEFSKDNNNSLPPDVFMYKLFNSPISSLFEIITPRVVDAFIADGVDDSLNRSNASAYMEYMKTVFPEIQIGIWLHDYIKDRKGIFDNTLADDLVGYLVNKQQNNEAMNPIYIPRFNLKVGELRDLILSKIQDPKILKRTRKEVRYQEI